MSLSSLNLNANQANPLGGWEQYQLCCLVSWLESGMAKRQMMAQLFSQLKPAWLLYPRSTEGGMGVYWIHPDVCPYICPSICPSVPPSVDKVSRTFWKTIGSIHFITGIYPYGVILLTPIHFRVPSLIFGPLVAKYLAENGVSGTFLKNYWPNSFHTWH